MENTLKSTKWIKVLHLTASTLLLLMAGFHASGTQYVSGVMLESNASPFLKEIFPVLFILPSLHLLGLAVLGIWALQFGNARRKIAWFIAASVMITTLLAFYLGAILPGGILLTTFLIFTIAAVKKI